MSNQKQGTNIICYVEIPATNPEKAAGFYNAVFGWTAKPSSLTEMNYWMFETTAGGMLGGFDGSKPVREDGMTFFINVSDIDHTLSQIQKAGGTVECLKEQIGGGYGFSATFRDNQGNRIGLWSDK